MRALAGLLAMFSATLMAAPAPSDGLRGVVLAADGSPAAGAIVSAARQTFGLPDRRETTADAQGRFILELPPGGWSVGARRGTQGGGLPGSRRKIEVVAGQLQDAVTIQLEERGRLRGRLLASETGRPVPGAWIAFSGGLVLKADDVGRFEIGGLARGFGMATAGGPGRERRRILFDTTDRADAQLDVSLRPGGTAIGRVTDAGGKPIPGAYVGDHATGFEACAADGQFVYHGLVLNSPHELTASAPGFADDSRTLVAAGVKSPATVNFRLRPNPKDDVAAPPDGGEPTRTVTGIVSGPDGKPLANALVRWGPNNIVGIPQIRTGPDGSYRLARVPDRDGLLTVFCKGLVPEFPRVAAGGDQTVDLSLSSGRTVTGVVQDDTGTPLANVWVAATVPNRGPQPFVMNEILLSEHETWTKSDGKFEVAGLPEQVRFIFLRTGLTDVRNKSLTESNNLVTMQHTGAIRGRVLDRDGKPVRTFRVRFAIPLRRPGPNERFAGMMVELVNQGLTYTTDDGSFLATGLSAGATYLVTVAADGHGEAIGDRVVAEPLNRLPAEPLTFQLGTPASLRVQVTAAKGGSPIARARVTLVNYELQQRQVYSWGSDDRYRDTERATTNQQGQSDFRSISFGAGTVLVQAAGYARRFVEWRRGQKELAVELQPEAILAGKVVDDAGSPVKECYVTVSSGTESINEAVAPEDQGRFRITELPAGPWTVQVQSGDGRTLDQIHVTLKAGETKEVDARAKRP